MAIAFFSTWTTYGTWLPGDDRGWFQSGRLHLPNHLRQLESAFRMTQDAITLTPTQRQLVETTIATHCQLRDWTLHAVNCRTNHIHVALTAPNRDIDLPREQFKSWCTRKLNTPPNPNPRKNWWTQRGWDEYLDHAHALTQTILYIRDGQDIPPVIDLLAGSASDETSS